VAKDPQFSARRLSFFIGRAWLLARGMVRALRAGDAATFERLAMERRSEKVSELQAVTLGVQKKVVPGSFCAFEFRMRRLQAGRLGAPLSFTEMFPMKAGPPATAAQDVPAETYLVLERPQRYKPRVLLDGGVVVFRDVMLLEAEAGPSRVSLSKDSRIEALAPWAGWPSLPAWDVAGALARVRSHEVDPLELPNELHEEVVLDQWKIGEPTTTEQRHAYPVQARGLVLDGVVAEGIEGQALRDNLERMRKGQSPLGLGPGVGKGKPSDSRRLFGVLHYETCRFVLQPLALLTAAGPIHLMMSAEGIDHKALLRNLVRR
jgi:hypothetical protein